MANHTLLQIRTAVKQETRVTLSGSLDVMIDRIINDIYQELCQNAEYDELFVPEATLTITSDQQTVFTKPADLRQIVYAEFSTDGLAWYRLIKRNPYGLPLYYGFPRWFYISSLGIKIFPFSSILTSHFLRVAYWKNPPVLASGDSILVEGIYNSIVKRAVDRVFRYHEDEKGARVFRQDAQEAEGRVVE